MMRGVTAVVKESLDRADAWVDRLRVVGIQRQGQAESAPWSPSSEGGGPPPLPSPLNLADTCPPFPVPADAPSHMTSSLGALSLASAHSTPKVSVRTLDEEGPSRYEDRGRTRSDMDVDS